MGKQITLYDRVQAFTRLADKGLVKEMIVKTNYTNFLPEFYGMTTLKKSDDGHTFVRVGTIENPKKFYSKLNSPIAVIPPWEQIETSTVSEGEKMDTASLIRKGRYLVVMVDLSEKKSVIMEDFLKLVGISEKGVLKSKNRERENVLDHWEIYDLYQKKNMKIVEIVRLKYPSRAAQKGNDALSLKNECMCISRAYNKAKSIIKQVRQDIGMDTMKGKKERKNHN